MKEDMYRGLPQGKDLLNTEDVAAYLGVGSVTVWRWCRDGSLPCLNIGREWRRRREALENFLKRALGDARWALEILPGGARQRAGHNPGPRDDEPPGRCVLPGRRGSGWKSNQIRRW